MNRRLLYFLLFSIPLSFILFQCKSWVKTQPDPRGVTYAGALTCAKCHKEIYSNFLHTAHFASTSLSSKENIGGSFERGKNIFAFNNDLKVVMEKKNTGFYQATYLKGKVIASERFDITVGAVKAETYLYWKNDRLFQLPVSYFNGIHRWTNSPGYDSTFADYTRPITVGCLECHSSFIRELPGPDSGTSKSNRFNKQSLILGIDCERCHGPAGDHVYYQTSHPDDTSGKYIIRYSSLTRVQKINMCAVCHSGSKGNMLRPTFGYKPNDNLTDYKIEDIFQTLDPEKLDMHGDQSRLLGSSKCFLMSKMDCATCHNVHKNERQQIALYSQKCMSCHSTKLHNFCKLAPVAGNAIVKNCIDCHMPAKPSSIITVGLSAHQKTSPYLVRSHYITVYNDETQKVLNMLKTDGRSKTQ